ncbi:LssY C-terminal domain-containing protein [Corynebacterium pelargi]|nr:LssY C-terminal domain-containing protein [Corynebacterium pelargi]
MKQTPYPVPKSYPTYHLQPPQKPSVGRMYALIDSTFVALGLLLVFWYVVVLLLSGLEFSWRSIIMLLGFWFTLTYLALPRMHQLFTTVYIPDYFMARTKTGDGVLGDPVNLALRGEEADIHAAMHRANWVKADPITLRSSLGIIMSSLKRTSYPAAPVSNLYLFGRKHDFAYQQEVDGNASQRHHIRFWRVPEGWELPGEKKVQWLAAGTYDRAVGLSTLTWQITHKIDANTDAERDYVIDSVRFEDPDTSVEVIENFSTAYHDKNGGGDAVHTDGNLPILDVHGAAQRAEEAGVDTGQSSNLVHLENQKLDEKLDKEIPPLQLGFVGLAVASKLVVLLIAVALLGFVHDDPEVGAALSGALGAIIATLIQGGLYVLTVRRKRWARLVFLIIASVGALGEMWRLTMADHPSIFAYLSVGLSVLVVLALSAPAVRAWVFALRRRSGVQ